MDTPQRQRARFLLAWLVLGTCLTLGLVPFGLMAQGTARSSGARHVVLRNGQILTGEVIPLGDRTQVLLPHGGEVNLPTKDVLLTCQSLDEAYRHFAAQITERRTATPHVELARWCLRNELLEGAFEQLALARELDRKHTSLPVLERQLSQLQRTAATPATLTPPEDAAPLSSYDSVASRVASRNTSSVETRRTHPPTMEELEESMRSIPKEGVEMFVNTIQPIMWNKCGTNRCHDVGGPSDFRVMKPTSGSQVWRRLSLRNLHTILTYIDRNEPDASPLLVNSREPHADLSIGALGGDESLHYQQLLIWVRGISGRGRPGNPSNLAATSPNVREPSPNSDTVIARASFESPVKPNPNTGNVDEPTTEENRAESPASRGQEDDANFVPRDPFDPEIFNRRYLRR